MANSDKLLIWLIFIQFAFFLSPAILWLVSAAFHAIHHPPQDWAGRRMHSRRSRFESYRRGAVVRHA